MLLGVALLNVIGQKQFLGNGCGSCFVTANLRIVCAEAAPLFVNHTLLRNLNFSVIMESNDEQLNNKDRAGKILQMVGANKRLMEEFNSEVTLDWATVLTSSEQKTMSVARALVNNPHLLCMSRPTCLLHAHQAKLVFEALRAHVDQSGLFMQGGHGGPERGPRTCIITASRDTFAELTDQVLETNSTAGVKVSKKSSTSVLCGRQ